MIKELIKKLLPTQYNEVVHTIKLEMEITDIDLLKYLYKSVKKNKPSTWVFNEEHSRLSKIRDLLLESIETEFKLREKKE